MFSRRRLLAGFASIGAVAGVFGLRSATARYYDGPVSDHFDGTRFFDLDGVPAKSVPKSLYDQWLWYRDGNRQSWPDRCRFPTRTHHLRASMGRTGAFRLSVMRASCCRPRD